MATPQPSDANIGWQTPQPSGGELAGASPPRPNARPRLDLFHSRTGPPHSCGGSLLLRPLYLLTRLRRQSPAFTAFTVFTALRTGLDQSGSVGPFGRGPGAPPAGRPAVEVGGRVSSPRQE